MARAGIEPEAAISDESARQLTFSTNFPHISIIRVRSFDVATFVAFGAAQLGVAGNDVLMEFDYPEIYTPLDLKIGKCQMMVAALQGATAPPTRVKVATKFVNAAKRHYAEKGVQVDIIKLYGAMELAPVTGLAHQIVDIVETGNTLKANGLVVVEHIADISTRLIVNKTSMKMKHLQIQKLITQLAGIVNNDD